MTEASESGSVSTELLALIQQAIATAGGWLPFDRFMALALYAPNVGYYSNALPKFGAMPGSGSDFITAPEMSPFFGRALAVQVAQALRACGSDRVIEFGAGSGALAEQLLDALAASAGAGAAAALNASITSYHIIELSSALRARQQQRLARFGARVQWLDAWPEVIDGVVIANEVLDAMPVQWLHFDGAQWFERGVVWAAAGANEMAGAMGEVGTTGITGAALRWRDQPTDLRPPFEGPFVPGTTTETHPQALAWTTGLAQRLRCGVAILIDYGFPQAEYYHPQRSGGTLMCHRAHRADTDPLADVGLKDITAHVDFSGIALAAQAAGCEIVGYTSQARFLINCGLMALLENATLAQRAMAQKLVTEHEMGELFKVLALARGCTFEPVGFSVGDRTHRL